MQKRPINSSRYQEKVRAILGLSGENPIPTIDELLQVLVIENDRPEWGFAGHETLAGFFVTQALVAGQFSFVALVNRPSSGMLIVVEAIQSVTDANLFVTAAGDVAAGAPFLVGETASTSGSSRDSRTPTPNSVAGFRSTGSNVVTPWFGPIAAFHADNHRMQLPCILLPDSAIIVVGAVAAAAVSAGFQWRERPLEQGDLA